MSRSNPTAGNTHPCTRWFEWNGETGSVKYYDKETKETVETGSDFTFIVLDELAVIKGWHEKSQSGITSNEIRDTRTEILKVRSFKGGEIIKGLYKAIKDQVSNIGGHFTTNVYITYKDGNELRLGSIQFKGAALNTWVEFKKENRSEILKKAIHIKGVFEGKKGRVIYKVPQFNLRDISEETNENACAIDRELQKYLAEYFKKSESFDPSEESQENLAERESAEYDPEEAESAEDVPF